MPASFTLKNASLEQRLFANRIFATSFIILLLSTGLIARLVYLQIAGHQYYSTLSRNNQVTIQPLSPTRGIIYDRHHNILAENIPSYSIELIPEQITNLDKTLVDLQRLLEISDEEIERFHKIRSEKKRFERIPLAIRLTEEQVARFAIRQPSFPGVDIHARLFRHYPYGALTSHIVGYVGRINEQELRAINRAQYRGTHHIGKTGIEKTYETTLLGQPGWEEIETNVRGRALRILNKNLPSPGADLHLTLDMHLQQLAHEAFGDFNGAAIAIEPETGAVRVFVSKPGFDPNAFVFSISSKQFKALQESPDRSLFNRALRGQYPPGSTLKPFYGLAGLEYSDISRTETVNCPGFYQLPRLKHRYRDWKKQGHGIINLNAAITQSCDVYFYNLAHTLGIDKMYTFMHQFGFGQLTGIDIIGEKPGLFPSREWKKRHFNQVWFPGETLIAGIGQGFVQTTPLQLAWATATLANRGKIIRPHVLDSENFAGPEIKQTRPDLSALALNPDHLNEIIDAMTNVVHGARGTARLIGKDIPYKIAGKTGTAQVFTIKQGEKYDEKKVIKKLRDHALFIAFAPVSKPRIAVAIVVENGGHGGSVAAPIAKAIIAAHLQSTQN